MGVEETNVIQIGTCVLSHPLVNRQCCNFDLTIDSKSEKSSKVLKSSKLKEKTNFLDIF